MGAVYEAIDQRLEATVALKETLSTDDRLLRQFEQEARLLAQLHHNCLPRVSDYFSEGGRAFLVMQFISGPDLAEVLSQQSAPFSRQRVIAWADQLLDALVYLHERDLQIIHRDIKPHNLKLMPNGRVALLDFGLAKTRAADSSTTDSSNSIFGYTRRYSPPEQIRDLGTTPQSDIYALGATLYHLLTGAKPPDALERAAAVANAETDPLVLMSPRDVIDAELLAVLNKAMALDCRDRFKSAREFREALRSVGNSAEANAPIVWRAELPARVPSAKRPNALIDPFESYSILKPDEFVFSSRKRRAPVVFTVAMAIVLVLVVLAIPSRLASSVAGIFEPAAKESSLPIKDEAAIPNKSEGSTVKVTTNRNTSPSPERFLRKEDQKRKTPEPTPAQPAEAKPPRISISPE